MWLQDEVMWLHDVEIQDLAKITGLKSLQELLPTYLCHLCLVSSRLDRAIRSSDQWGGGQ